MKVAPEHIQACLNGQSLSSVAKVLGVNVNTLRREVVKHPDYAEAKASGRMHARGLPGKVELDREALRSDPAILEVLNGSPTTEVAAKYGMHQNTLASRFHKAYPGINLHKGRKTAWEAAQEAVRRAREALAVAEANLRHLERTLP